MKKILFALIALFSLAACVEDNGNYTYHDINEVETVFPEVFKRVYLEDQTVRVEPGLTQTMAENRDNLTFMWKYSTLSSAAARNSKDTLSTESFVDLEIHATDNIFNHYYWLEIHDALTDMTYTFQSRVWVVKPFINAWAILHSDGATKLGAVEYLLPDADGVRPDPVLHTDMMTEFGNPALTGAPVALGEDNNEQILSGSTTYYNVLYLMTDNAEESGAYAPWTKFTPMAAGTFLPQMVENYSTSGFNPALTTYAYKPNGDGGIVVNNGALFQGRFGLKLYKVAVDAAVMGAVNIAKAVRLGGIALLWDDAGQRFLYLNIRSNGGTNATIGNFLATENSQKIMSMSRVANTIPPDGIIHTVLGMGVLPRINAMGYQTVESFAIANGAGNKTYIYLFNQGTNISGSAAVLKEIKEVDTPAGLNASSCFASSTMYSGMAFYSAGNSVYRFDFTTGLAQLIYTHPEAGTVVAMRMAKQEPPSTSGITFDSEAFGHEPGRSLGVAINDGATGYFVTLNLNEAGMVVGKSSYSGLGAIKDIAFLADRKIVE